MFEVKHSTYGCVIRETSPCPAGSTTCSNDPYADACDQAYSVAKKDKETELVAMIPGGTCYMRPADCTKVECLQAEVPCPPGPDKAMPPKTGQWQVEKTGVECRITPKNPTYKSPRIAPYDMPCPDYPDNPSGFGVASARTKGAARSTMDRTVPPGTPRAPRRQPSTCRARRSDGYFFFFVIRTASIARSVAWTISICCPAIVISSPGAGIRRSFSIKRPARVS